jgi:hypothetical protein
MSRQDARIQKAGVQLVLSRAAGLERSAVWLVSGLAEGPIGKVTVSGEYNPVTGRYVLLHFA